jgi:hypothetical protein
VAIWWKTNKELITPELMHEWLDQLQILIIGTSSEALHNASFLI